MIEFLHLILVIVLVLIKEIACLDSLQGVLSSYYDSEIQRQFKQEWTKYQPAFENAVVSGLQENFGSSAVNIYVAERYEAQLIAGGFHLSDGVVNVYFYQMLLRELPALVRPKLKIELPSNHLKFESKVGRMFIDTTYYVARNTSSVIYARPEDQKTLSPFSLQQVDNFGKVAIIAEDCTLSGISIVTLSGESVNLGHTPIQLSDCKFTVEISTPNSGAPPVIAPYFPKGPKEKLELILGRPIVEELTTKLQGTMYSYINTTVLFGDQVVKFRDNQHKLFTSYSEFIKNYVSSLNQKTLKLNKGQVSLEDYNVFMDAVSEKIRSPCHLALTGLVLYGLDTAYVSRTGGPYLDGAPGTAADSIVFSSMQIRGKASHDDNGTSTFDFAAELTDITTNIIITIGKEDAKVQNITLTGWRSLEFSIIPWETHVKERIGYQSLVYGHILNALPTRVISHLRSVLEDLPIDEDKQDGGSGAIDSDDKSVEKRDQNKGGGTSMDADSDNKDSSDSKHIHDNGTNINDDKKKEFFTDDNLDKEFFTDDNIDKNFFSDDKIKKDFFDGNAKDTEEDDKGNQDGGDGGDKGVSDSNSDGNTNMEKKENISGDDKSDSKIESADEGQDTSEKVISSDAGVEKAKIIDSKDGVDNIEVTDANFEGISSGNQRDKNNVFFTDDNISKQFFTDDNIQEGLFSEDKTDSNNANNRENNKVVGSDGSIGAVDSDNVRNMTSDGEGKVSDGDMNSDSEGQVDGDNSDVSDDDEAQIEVDSDVSIDDKYNATDGNEKVPRGSDNTFFTDDNIENDFFTDDNIKNNFFTDDNVDKNFFNDEEAPAGENDSKNYSTDQKKTVSNYKEDSQLENDESENPVDDNTGGSSSDENNNNKNTVPIKKNKKDFFTDDNLEKDFFTDDILQKEFFTDDNIEKDFFTDDNIKKDFISDTKVDDNEEKNASVDDEEEKSVSNTKKDEKSEDRGGDKEDGASSSYNDDANVDDERSKGNVKDMSDDDEVRDNETLDSAGSSVSDDSKAKPKFTSKETETNPEIKKKKLSKNKPFLEENFFIEPNMEKNFFSDDNMEKGFVSDEMRRNFAKSNATADIPKQITEHLNDDDSSRDTSEAADKANKNSTIKIFDSKEIINESSNSNEAKKNVLPLNVHNARRLDNLHMSENEIH